MGTTKEAKPCADALCDRIVKRSSGLCGRHERLRYPEDPEKRRASWRAKNHRRRARTRTAYDEVTAQYERALRVKAKRCPLCNVRLTDKPYTPTSKELDHIIPRIVGGTHTIGNVRVLCRQCNITRPKDGSDYSGPVTLWAEMPWAEQLRPTRLIGYCPCGVRRVKGRCPACTPTPKPRLNRVAEGYQAADLRALGWKWQDIADATGFASTGACYVAAKAHGAPEVVTRWPARYVNAMASHAAMAPMLTQAVPSLQRGDMCVDCDDPVARGSNRCSDCLIEIEDTQSDMGLVVT